MRFDRFELGIAPSATPAQVRAGDFIFVTGTVGIEADGSYAPEPQGTDAPRPGHHHRRGRGTGGKAADIVRTRMFVTDIDKWKEAGAVHRELFDHIRPALTMVQIARLIDTDALIEIEADALIHEEDRDRLA